jgi:hypothetical protein
LRSLSEPTQTKPSPDRRDGKALEVDAHVHDLDLADRGGDLALELAAQPVGDGDHRRRAADHVARRPRGAGDAADVRTILAVRGDDERAFEASAAASPAGTRKCA